MPRLRRIAALLLALLPLAGCLAPAHTSDSPSPVVPPAAQGTGFQKGVLPSGDAARGYIASYVMNHPYRVAGAAFDGLGTMAKARDDLAGLLKGFGNLSVSRDDYGGGINILAVQNGTLHPEQWVVLSAHYDLEGAGVGSTVYGAWDDGAGTAAVLELAHTLSTWRFPFSIVYVFFDQEEAGLVGSSHFAQKYVNDGKHDILADINTDPPGLNWPCGDATGPFVVKIIHELDKVDRKDPAKDRFSWLFAAIDAGLNATKVPAAARDYDPGIPIVTANGFGLTGSSDEVSFGKQGVANVFLGSAPTTRAGPAAALTYPLHTPLDTLQDMDLRCASGGAASTLAGGMGTIVGSFAGALEWMALHPAPPA
jgi:hypothetical protein